MHADPGFRYFNHLLMKRPTMLRLDPLQTLHVPTGMSRRLSFRRLREPTRLPTLAPRGGSLGHWVERALGLFRPT